MLDVSGYKAGVAIHKLSRACSAVIPDISSDAATKTPKNSSANAIGKKIIIKIFSELKK